MVLRIKKFPTITRQKLNIFITGLLLLPIYISLMGRLAQVLGFNTKITSYFYYGGLWFFLLLSIPQITQSISNNMTIGIGVTALFVIGQMFIFPNNINYLIPSTAMEILSFTPATFVAAVPYILIGFAVTNMNELGRMMHVAARIGVVCGFLSYLIAIFGGQDIRYDDMANAYALCNVTCVLVTGYKKNDIYFLVLGVVSLLLAGTRGPLLCVVMAVLFRVLLLEPASIKKTIKIVLGIIIIVLLQTDLLLETIEIVERGFAIVGVRKLRIVDLFRDGMLADSSGRDRLAKLVIDKIWDNPIIGNGVGSDRIILGGNRYVHNLALEMWVSYGVILGTCIFAWMTYWPVKGIFSKNVPLMEIATALFCSVYIKLFLSSSYLHSKELFLLIGLCISGHVRQNNRMKEEGTT